MLNLEGEVAIVTGASVGLGRSMALALAAAGARVTLASPQTALLEDVAAQITKAHGPGARSRSPPTSRDAINATPA